MKKATNITFHLIFSALLFLPALARADESTTRTAVLKNPLGEADTIMELVTAILQKVVLPLGTTVVVFFIIYSGFLFVTAQGNEEKLVKAKTAIVWTLIGAAILFGATVFSTLICETVRDLGVELTCSI